MNETLTLTPALALALAWVAGAALGAFFFGGLWWTVRKLAASARPALWVFGSALARMGIALAGFYLVGGGHWERLLACLLGFVSARLAVTWLTRVSAQRYAAAEASHAP